MFDGAAFHRALVRENAGACPVCRLFRVRESLAFLRQRHRKLVREVRTTLATLRMAQDLRRRFGVSSLIRSILSGLAFACSVAGAMAASADALQLPFGLAWDFHATSVIEALGKAGVKSVERSTLPGRRENWTITGLPQEGLKQTILSFRESVLAGLELQYSKDDWDYTTYDEFMHRVRGSLEERYGAGRQIARSKEPNDRVMQTLVGYAWTVGKASIELVYFAAQDGQNAFRMVSLHYKAKADAEPETEPTDTRAGAR